MEKDINKITPENIKEISPNDIRLLSPKDRLNQYFDKAENFAFDPNKSVLQYFRSIKQLIKQGDVYMNEGDLTCAYIYYIRFMKIFLEKLKHHPQYKTISFEDKNQMKNYVKEILPKTEEIKQILLEQFNQEHIKCKQEFEEQERMKVEILKQEEKQRLQQEEDKKKQMVASATNVQYFGIYGDITKKIVNDDKSKTQIVPPKTYITNDIKEHTKSSTNRKVPFIDRSTKPSSLSSNDKLRNIIIPSELMRKFLKLASSNTFNNTETCGILAGRLECNKLLVTHFLIPKQSGSSDSCTTHNEEDIFDFQDQHDLIALGWIHTHPTQTAFLSSVDLHTHCAYQLMIAEAIAIVCAPKYDEIGFFHLTPEYGLNYIANCRETGFHPHPIEPLLFTTAKHFSLDPLASINAVDLRNK